jgi:hypothetical protein
MKLDSEHDPAGDSNETPENAAANDSAAAAAKELLDAVDANRICIANASIGGVLAVHYRLRDVLLEIDGDMAMRIFRAWQLQGCQDPIVDPQAARASAGLIGIDVAEVYGLTWSPRSGLNGGPVSDVAMTA